MASAALGWTTPTQAFGGSRRRLCRDCPKRTLGSALERRNVVTGRSRYGQARGRSARRSGHIPEGSRQRIALRRHGTADNFGPRDTISSVCVAADNKVMEEDNLDAVRDELTALEAAEARVSAERRRLHQQMDFGYSVSESLRAREREASAERRELHRRIDDLQQVLGIERTALVSARKGALAVRELETESESERPQFLTSG